MTTGIRQRGGELGCGSRFLHSVADAVAQIFCRTFRATRDTVSSFPKIQVQQSHRVEVRRRRYR